MSIKFFLILFFLKWVLLKINFDISWSVIAKCIKGPLISTHSACENVFTKQLIELLLILCGDVEQNPGPEKEKSHITFCHWNLNGLMAHNFIKVSLLQTLAVTNGYDIIFFCGSLTLALNSPVKIYSLIDAISIMIHINNVKYRIKCFLHIFT